MEKVKEQPQPQQSAWTVSISHVPNRYREERILKLYSIVAPQKKENLITKQIEELGNEHEFGDLRESVE